MRDINVTAHDGIELAVRDYGGDGPDVLLLHGATRNLEDWGAVRPHLRGIRVVAMDQRFHGLSGVSAPTTPSDWVHDIEVVIRNLDLNPFVVGHSLGGVNALAYAVEHPECRGVLDLDGYDIRQPELYDELPPERVHEFIEGFTSRSASFVPASDEGDDDWHHREVEGAKQMDAAWGVDPAVTQAVIERAFVRSAEGRWERRPPAAFWGSAIADGMEVDVLDLARRTSCPATVLLCTKPIAMPMGSAAEFLAAGRRGVSRHLEAIAAERPNLAVETIDATHGVIHERPAEIAELITSLATS